MIAAKLGNAVGNEQHTASGALKVLVIGQGSFIGNAMVRLEYPGIQLTAASHADAARQAQSNRFDAILNCALDPRFKSAAYHTELDADLAAARLSSSCDAHLVMLSSRRVYASRGDLRTIQETEAPAPDTQYGRNKLESENRVRELLQDRCTILRISNVFGYEPGRSTFFGQAVSSLRRERRIILDVSPFVVRDFIPVATLCGILAKVLLGRPAGIFNVGAGFGVAVGQIALWLIRGMGAGELVVTNPEERDAFVLDSAKIRRAIPGCPAAGDIEAIVTAIGETARDA